MKITPKISFADIFSNPINRNLILILVIALVMAIIIVTGGIIVYNQF
jgi:hypothetical protein